MTKTTPNHTQLLRLALYSLGALILLFSVLALPALANSASTLNPDYAYLKWPLLLGIWATLIPFFAAFFFAHQLLRQIDIEDPFSEKSLQALYGIYKSALALLLMYLVGMVFLFSQNALHPSILIMGICILVLTACVALFASILHTLFTQALALKDEQALTI